MGSDGPPCLLSHGIPRREELKLYIKNAIITAGCLALKDARIRATGRSVPRRSAVPGREETASRETRAYLKMRKTVFMMLQTSPHNKEEGL